MSTFPNPETNRVTDEFLSMSSCNPKSSTYCDIIKHQLNKSIRSDFETAVLKGKTRHSRTISFHNLTCVNVDLCVQQKLQDAGRTLKSKTNDVVQYGAHRNADHIEADAKEKSLKAQKEYTDSL